MNTLDHSIACLIVYGLGAGVPLGLFVYLARARWLDAGWAGIVAAVTSFLIFSALAAAVGAGVLLLPNPVEHHGILYGYTVLGSGLRDCPAEIIVSIVVAGGIGYLLGGKFPNSNE